jgi:hypothetical protein
MSATLLPFLWEGGAARVLEDDQGLIWKLDAGSGDAWRLTSILFDQTVSLPARGKVEGAVAPGEFAAWEAWRKSFARFADESGLGTRVVPLPMKRGGDGHKGWLHMDGKRRRVLYTPTLGLVMLSEKDEEQAR